MQLPPVQESKNLPETAVPPESNDFMTRMASLATYLQIPQQVIPRVFQNAVPTFMVKPERKSTGVLIKKVSNPTLLLAMKLSWVQKAFQEILKPLGWPKFTPEPFSSYFIAVKLLLEKIDLAVKFQKIQQRDQRQRVAEIFIDDFEKYQPPRECYYPAEIYFIALNIVKNPSLAADHRSNTWSITVSPALATVMTAQSLVENTDIVFDLLQNCNESDFYKAFEAFDESWECFMTCLAKERLTNYCCWCGTMMLNMSLRRLSQDKIFQERQQKIEQLADQFPDNAETKGNLSDFYVLISYIVNKKMRQHNSHVYTGLLSSPIAEILLKLANDDKIRKTLEKMVKENEIVLIDMILQLACLELDDLSNNPDACPPLFKSQISEVIGLHAKLSYLRKHYANKYDVMKILQKRIIESHAELLVNSKQGDFSSKSVMKALDIHLEESPEIIKEIFELKIEEEMKAICLTIYHRNLQAMGGIIELLLLDYRMLNLVRELKITLLAQAVIDLGLRTYDSSSFDSGFVREISLITHK